MPDPPRDAATDSADPPAAAQTHGGYDLETGLLARLRDWTDVLGWLRLARTTRIAGSPLTIAGLWLVVCSIAALTGRSPAETFNLDAWWKSWGPISFVVLVLFLLPLLVFLAVFLARQGALLTAGRGLGSLASVARLSIRRLPAVAWAMSIVAATLVFVSLPLLVILQLAEFLQGNGWATLSRAIGLVAAVAAIVPGIIMAGGVAAIPIAVAALANERDSDPLDALSRGYEYLFRRPLQLAGYVAVQSILVIIIVGLYAAFAWGAKTVASIGWWLVGGGPIDPMIEHVRGLLDGLPQAAAIGVAGAGLGGIYLLLRQDANQQEVEDLWIESEPTPTALPEVPIGQSD